MIARSPFAKVIALGFAASVVIGVVQIAFLEQPTKIEGGGAQVEARMGSRFEDMSAGTLHAIATDDETPNAPPPSIEDAQTIEETVQPTQSDATPQTTPEELAITEPMATAQVQPDQTPPPSASKLAAIPAVPLAPAQSADVVLPSPMVPVPVLTPQIAAAKPVQMQPIAPPKTIASEAPDSAAPPQSIRPKRKDPELAAKVAASRPKVTAPAPKVAQATPKRGNANRNNTQGAANGTNQRAKPKASGAIAKRAKQAGNAAVSNYPGQVMRRISRVSKPRVRSRGTAVIAFSISSGGGLAGLSVARSSGSAALDQAALGVIRKAAPFPRPPAGARRQFSIRIKGR